MPKVPRDLSGRELCGLLEAFGYQITRELGSNIRLTRTVEGARRSITIPDHRPIKIGTLNSVLAQIAEEQKISKKSLIEKLFQ
jgi:predicted RNA binding protein YcfA (HicA-like mRNA interferase family)